MLSCHLMTSLILSALRSHCRSSQPDLSISWATTLLIVFDTTGRQPGHWLACHFCGLRCLWVSISQITAPSRLRLNEGGLRAELAHLLIRGGGEDMHHARNGTGPAGLMIGPKTGAVVTVEIFVELDEVAPVGIFLELFGPSINRAAAIMVFQENQGDAAGDFLGNLIKIHSPPGARRTFNDQGISVIGIIIHQGPEDQEIDRHPDGAAPV